MNFKSSELIRKFYQNELFYRSNGKKLGLTTATLRYYEKEGLLPFVERTSGGIRQFTEKDFEWLMIIDCLKKTGMPLKDIRSFIEMVNQGDSTIENRLNLIQKQKKSVENQLAELAEILKVLEFKEWFYATALQDGTTENVMNMNIEDLPEPFQETRKKLIGKEYN